MAVFPNPLQHVALLRFYPLWFKALDAYVYPHDQISICFGQMGKTHGGTCITPEELAVAVLGLVNRGIRLAHQKNWLDDRRLSNRARCLLQNWTPGTTPSMAEVVLALGRSSLATHLADHTPERQILGLMADLLPYIREEKILQVFLAHPRTKVPAMALMEKGWPSMTANPAFFNALVHCGKRESLHHLAHLALTPHPLKKDIASVLIEEALKKGEDPARILPLDRESRGYPPARIMIGRAAHMLEEINDFYEALNLIETVGVLLEKGVPVFPHWEGARRLCDLHDGSVSIDDIVNYPSGLIPERRQRLAEAVAPLAVEFGRMALDHSLPGAEPSPGASPARPRRL
jgi:hypothetical protein